MERLLFIRFLALAVLLSPLTVAQEKAKALPAASVTPEMERLARALAGDWINRETMEHSRFFPNGGERSGTSHCVLETGGAALRCEGESDGSAGKLNHLIVIWWDDKGKLYGFFTCFKDKGGSGCKVRGSAHWEGDVFVNDYTEIVDGRETRMRDSFIEITPNSHTLTAAIETTDRKMKTLVTTRSARR